MTQHSRIDQRWFSEVLPGSGIRIEHTLLNFSDKNMPESVADAHMCQKIGEFDVHVQAAERGEYVPLDQVLNVLCALEKTGT